MALASAFATPLAARADASAGALTLGEAVSRALAASPRSTAFREHETAARLEARAASLSRLPRVALGLEARRADHPVHVFGSLLAQEAFGQSDFGTIDPVTGSFDLDPLNRPDPHTNVRASVTLRQTLWTGGAVTGRLDGLRAGAEGVSGRARRDRQRLAYDTEAAFRRTLLAEQRLDLLRENLAAARRHAESVSHLHEEGLALGADRRALEAQVAEAEARLEGARADSVAARSYLGLLLGADAPVARPLADPGPPPERDLPALDEAVARAELRADVRAAIGDRAAARAHRKIAVSRMLPDLELAVGIEHNSETAFGTGGSQWMVGLGARMELDAGVPSAIRSASAETRAADARLDQVWTRARHEIAVAYAGVETARRRFLALRAAEVAAAESHRLTEERHREGLATTLELIESRNSWTRTRLAAVEAIHDAALARSALDLATGAAVEEEN